MSMLKLLQKLRPEPEEEKETQKPKKTDSRKKTSRKRKKDKPQPWGKKERILVFFILSVTIFLPAILAMSARDWKLPGWPRIRLPSFESTFILEANHQLGTSFSGIQSDFKKKTRKLSGVYGFKVIHLKDSQEYGLYADEVFPAASLIKLPVLISLFQEAEAGQLNLDQTYVLKETDKIGGAGSLQYKSAGTKISYRQMAELMGQESDNTAFNIVRNYLGDRKIQETIFDLGLTQTSLSENETSPQDMALLFEELWQGKILSQKSRDEILGYLTETVFENHLTAGIPGDIRVSHKYGREVHIVNDAGIVFTEEPFVLVLMSKGVIESEADTIFPELAKLIYEFEVASLK